MYLIYAGTESGGFQRIRLVQGPPVDPGLRVRGAGADSPLRVSHQIHWPR